MITRTIDLAGGPRQLVDERAAPRATDPELTPATTVAVEGDPVDLDDLLDVHRVLAAWDGDMHGLLRRLDGAEGTVAR